MKKLFLLIVLILFFGIQDLFAQYPIPSYNVGVDPTAYFIEGINHKIILPNTDAKRKVIIRITCPPTDGYTCSATVWVFSLDGETRLGPYRMNGGDILEVEIDEKEWGVRVDSEERVIVDVWTDGFNTPPGTSMKLDEGECLGSE
jgi:hypothetical protein